jgi:ABC-2 type transport system permease protein
VILAIARREWQATFLSPVAWGLLAANQLVLAWIFLQVLERFSGLAAAQRAAGLTLELNLNLFGFAAVLALVSLPLLAMGTLAGQLRDGSFNLLGAAPVGLAQILAGKLLGLLGIAVPLGLLPGAMGLLLLPAVDLDLGLLASATLGLWLVGLLFAAVGLYGSSLSARPGLGAVAAYGILILLSVINRGDLGGDSLLAWLSWNEHLFWFLIGVVRASDVLYFVLLTGFFLALAHRRLANRRLD